MKRMLIIVVGLILAACSSASPTTTTLQNSTQPPAQIVQQATLTGQEAAPIQPTDEPMVEAPANLPAWQTVQLTNARTGEAFTLADFAGKTVFVEPMATWCTNCRAQLGRVRQVRERLGEDDYAFVALSLETNLTLDALAQYTNNQGFDWHFAVMSEEMLRLLADEFGRSVTVAPSTPHFVIRPDGTFTTLNTGAKSVDDIAQQLIDEGSVQS